MTLKEQYPYLTDTEIKKLVNLNNDAVTKEALRKVLLTGIYYNGTLLEGLDAEPTRNFLLSFVFTKDSADNEKLGQDVRASAEGIRHLEQAFGQLENFVNEEKSERKSDNPAK